MNTKISEKMVTGLFVIWLAVVLFLTVQINTYKTENEKLKGKNLVDAKYEEGVINFSQLLEMVAKVSPASISTIS